MASTRSRSHRRLSPAFRGDGRSALAAAGVALGGTWALVAAACVFTPPPPLPEEVAAAEAEQAARSERVNAGEAVDPEELDEKGSRTAEGEDAGSRFAPGDPPELGMSFEDMQAYAEAQGDPERGDFTLEQALEGLPEQGELWARFETARGAIECRLLPELAPRTVANFVGLARGKRPFKDPVTEQWETGRYYDRTEFHRVIEGFMIQGGDPSGTGRGNAGYVIPDELDPDVRHDEAGKLSMANRGAGTGSSQFFITLAPTPHLDDKHTIFGECTESSIEIAEAIAATGGPDDRPTEPQIIDKVIIERRPASKG